MLPVRAGIARLTGMEAVLRKSIGNDYSYGSDF